MERTLKKGFLFLTVLVFVFLSGCQSTDYENAIKLFDSGDYQAAKIEFIKLGDYKDSAKYLLECRYQLACSLMKEESYEKAMSEFKSLGNFKDSADYINECQYQMANALVAGKNYNEALIAFNNLGNYKDSMMMARKVKWSILYEYIQIKGKQSTVDDYDYKMISISIPNDNEKKLHLFACSPDCFIVYDEYYGIYSSGSDSGAGIIRNFALTIERESPNADWTMESTIGLLLGSSGAGVLEKASGKVELASCKKNTVLKMDSYLKTIKNIYGKTSSSTDKKDETISSSLKQAWEETIQYLPTILESTDCPFSMNDFGFLEIT